MDIKQYELSFNELFSKRLRHYLSIYNMTQAELAQRLGVGTTSVSNWCKGIKSPRMDKVDKMCIIFNCTRSDLMEENKTPSESDNSAVTISIQLTPDQQKLLDDYMLLNDAGQEQVRNHMDFVLSQDKFTKDTPHALLA